MFSRGPCFRAPVGSFWDPLDQKTRRGPKEVPRGLLEKGSQKIPTLGTPFFLKIASKMEGGLHISSFVPAPSQTLPLLPTWRGKANRKVPRICPFTFHVAEQLRNPRVLFFQFWNRFHLRNSDKRQNTSWFLFGTRPLCCKCGMSVWSCLGLVWSWVFSCVALPCLSFLLLLLFTTKKNSNLPGRETKLNINITKKCTNILRKKHRCWDPFWVNFGVILGPILRPGDCI